jgi:hypothetical protein
MPRIFPGAHARQKHPNARLRAESATVQISHPEYSQQEYEHSHVTRETRRPESVSSRAVATVASASSKDASSSAVPRPSHRQDRQNLPVSVTAAVPPPASNQDLILRMWNSLTWTKAGQASFLLIVVGITVTLVFASLGMLVHALIGISVIWSAIGGVSTSVATIIGAERCLRRWGVNMPDQQLEGRRPTSHRQALR